MKPLSTSELVPLQFEREKDGSQKIKMQSNKIGWLHSLTDKSGAQFDVTIKDALGRLKFQGTIKGGTERSGALINLPGQLGEELEISVQNIKNADKVQLFLN